MDWVSPVQPTNALQVSVHVSKTCIPNPPPPRLLLSDESLLAHGSLKATAMAVFSGTRIMSSLFENIETVIGPRHLWVICDGASLPRRSGCVAGEFPHCGVNSADISLKLLCKRRSPCEQNWGEMALTSPAAPASALVSAAEMFGACDRQRHGGRRTATLTPSQAAVLLQQQNNPGERVQKGTIFWIIDGSSLKTLQMPFNVSFSKGLAWTLVESPLLRWQTCCTFSIYLVNCKKLQKFFAASSLYFVVFSLNSRKYTNKNFTKVHFYKHSGCRLLH